MSWFCLGNNCEGYNSNACPISYDPPRLYDQSPKQWCGWGSTFPAYPDVPFFAATLAPAPSPTQEPTIPQVHCDGTITIESSEYNPYDCTSVDEVIIGTGFTGDFYFDDHFPLVTRVIGRVGSYDSNSLTSIYLGGVLESIGTFYVRRSATLTAIDFGDVERIDFGNEDRTEAGAISHHPLLWYIAMQGVEYVSGDFDVIDNPALTTFALNPCGFAGEITCRNSNCDNLDALGCTPFPTYVGSMNAPTAEPTLLPTPQVYKTKELK